jgi:hypothetical protein
MTTLDIGDEFEAFDQTWKITAFRTTTPYDDQVDAMNHRGQKHLFWAEVVKEAMKDKTVKVDN